MNLEAGYGRLKEHFQQSRLLESSLELLGWDERTYLPPKGFVHRSNQNALLAKIHHEWISASWVGDLLLELEPDSRKLPFNHECRVNVREWLRQTSRARKIPTSFVEELSKSLVFSQQAWQEAKQKNEFSVFLPWLKKIVELKRSEASFVKSDGSHYDALLDEYEPGFKSEKLDQLIGEIKPRLQELLKQFAEMQKGLKPGCPAGKYPVEKQKILSELLAGYCGFDFSAGRLDTTAHPFCTGIGPGDCRITTKFSETDFTSGLLGVLHEAGHGIYEQGLKSDHYGLPTGSFCSLGIHESQSRLFENLIGRTLKFWQWAFPLAQRIFSPVLDQVEVENFVQSLNLVTPNFIRIESDELTYNFHIMLRYELERDLISGNLLAEDLPDAWNEAVFKNLGLKVLNDGHGCLQDIHWSAGLFGYFPTYMLGNIFSAQLMHQARLDLGWNDVSMEKFLPQLVKWLREKIHSQGKTYSSERLVENATGKPLSATFFLEHLCQKLTHCH